MSHDHSLLFSLFVLVAVCSGIFLNPLLLMNFPAHCSLGRFPHFEAFAMGRRTMMVAVFVFLLDQPVLQSALLSCLCVVCLSVQVRLLSLRFIRFSAVWLHVALHSS